MQFPVAVHFLTECEVGVNTWWERCRLGDAVGKVWFVVLASLGSELAELLVEGGPVFGGGDADVGARKETLLAADSVEMQVEVVLLVAQNRLCCRSSILRCAAVTHVVPCGALLRNHNPRVSVCLSRGTDFVKRNRHSASHRAWCSLRLTLLAADSFHREFDGDRNHAWLGLIDGLHSIWGKMKNYKKKVQKKYKKGLWGRKRNLIEASVEKVVGSRRGGQKGYKLKKKMSFRF